MGRRAGVSKATSEGGDIFGAGRRFVERDARRSHFPRRGPNAPGVRYRGPMARPRPRCLGSECSHWQADLSAYHALALSSSRRRWWGCGLIAFSQSLTHSLPHSRPLLKGLTALTPSEDGAYGFDMQTGGPVTRASRAAYAVSVWVWISANRFCGSAGNLI